MAKERVLVVDDEESILELVKYNLTKEGYEVSCLRSGEQVRAHAANNLPDLILLDLMLPGLHGLDVCKELKTDPTTSVIPVVMITAKGEDADIVAGLEVGADDYITKPFSPRVLLARVRAALRRKRREDPTPKHKVAIHDLSIDPARHEVLAAGKAVTLTATEFNILYFLALRPGWVFSRDQIIDAVKGQDYPVTERSVDVQIVGLRKKLGDSGAVIETVRGVGYRLRD